ncbi:hypothetical protein [uncultured Oscillibacter sp.]|uniref:hypothetical protein n=1 Tax=uncultured Oscillibacter sp. TaxID=876091 RepID=UPI0025E0394B|nr:hypothetical protein [uncultured Oscillibacter sp.]
MKRTKIVSLLLLICVTASLLCVQASARSSNYLDAYRVVLTPQSGGKIVITVDVDGIRNMTQIGASTIFLYESRNGTDFTRIKTYNYEDYPTMMGSGIHHYKDAATYYGVVGRYYYATAYCYAGDETGYDEKSYTTSIVRAKA